MNMENNLPSRKINIFSIIGFIVSLLPTLGFVLVLFYQNKAAPTAFDLFLGTFFFKPSFVYAGVGIVLAIISLVVTHKTNERGKVLAYVTVALGIITILVTYRFIAFQENRLRSYELEQQLQIQGKLQNNR